MRNAKTILLGLAIVVLLGTIGYLAFQLQGPGALLTSNTNAQDAESVPTTETALEPTVPVEPTSTEIAYVSTDTITPSPTVPAAVIPTIPASPTPSMRITDPTITPTSTPQISTLPVAGITDFLPHIFVAAGTLIFFSFLF